MNLSPNLHAENVTEKTTTPVGPRFDLSTELTLALTFVLIFVFKVNSVYKS